MVHKPLSRCSVSLSPYWCAPSGMLFLVSTETTGEIRVARESKRATPCGGAFSHARRLTAPPAPCGWRQHRQAASIVRASSKRLAALCGCCGNDDGESKSPSGLAILFPLSGSPRGIEGASRFVRAGVRRAGFEGDVRLVDVARAAWFQSGECKFRRGPVEARRVTGGSGKLGIRITGRSTRSMVFDIADVSTNPVDADLTGKGAKEKAEQG
jgi:hypothetical protein